MDFNLIGLVILTAAITGDSADYQEVLKCLLGSPARAVLELNR